MAKKLSRQKHGVAILTPTRQKETKLDLIVKYGAVLTQTRSFWKRTGFTDADIKRQLVKTGRRYALPGWE